METTVLEEPSTGVERVSRPGKTLVAEVVPSQFGPVWTCGRVFAEEMGVIDRDVRLETFHSTDKRLLFELRVEWVRLASEGDEWFLPGPVLSRVADMGRALDEEDLSRIPDGVAVYRRIDLNSSPDRSATQTK